MEHDHYSRNRNEKYYRDYECPGCTSCRNEHHHLNDYHKDYHKDYHNYCQKDCHNDYRTDNLNDSYNYFKSQEDYSYRYEYQCDCEKNYDCEKNRKGCNNIDEQKEYAKTIEK